MIKIVSIEIKILRKPFPWELRVSHWCKAEAQIVCKECGWAQCVPTTDGKEMVFDRNYKCCPNVLSSGYCCPLNYEFKCCAVVSQQKYTLRPKIPGAIGKKCNDGKACFCGQTRDWLMRGFCCDKSEACECCETDPTVTKIPAPVRDTLADASCKAEITAKAVGKRVAICREALGSPATGCCAKDYKLEYVDELKPDALDLLHIDLDDIPRDKQQACNSTMSKSRTDAFDLFCKPENGWPETSCCGEDHKLVSEPGDIVSWSKFRPHDYNDLCEDQMARLDDPLCRKTLGNPATDCCGKDYKFEFVRDLNKDELDKPITMLPRLGRQACQNQIHEESRKQTGPHCVWALGWKASNCCPENYKFKFQVDLEEMRKGTFWKETARRSKETNRVEQTAEMIPGEGQQQRVANRWGFSNLSAKFAMIDKRLESLEQSWRSAVPLSTHASVAGTSAMSFDNAEKRFLLCGNARGGVAIVDFESFSNFLPNAERYPRNYVVIQTRKKSHHEFMVNGCQWYPVDSSIFATSGRDKFLKIWDADQLKSVEQFAFQQPISNFHWFVPANCNSSLISIATSSSNVDLLDPRLGNSAQQIRCSRQRIWSVQWVRACDYVLATGSDSGEIAFWDVRSSKNELKRRTVVSLSLSHTTEMFVSGRLKQCDCFVVLRYRNLKVIAALFLCNLNFVTRDALFGSAGAVDQFQFLRGHFQSVLSCAYRKEYNQLVTSSTDRLVLVWAPQMDEYRFDSAAQQIKQLHEDAFSDDESR
uniref:WD_REPEATS_REGION domain-containing protein n=1 Tax=Globodera pallida TaxID=36090 RepID=A0A183BKZ4_GLOPA